MKDPQKQTLVVLALLISLAFPSLPISAATIVESGTLGPTGVAWESLVNQTVPGANINTDVLTGVRFELTSPAETSGVGGHFVAPLESNFFGAIVKLV